MSTRITRSHRNTENCVPENVSNDIGKRRQNKKSDEKTIEEITNVTPPKQRKFTKNMNSNYSPTTLMNKMTLDGGHAGDIESDENETSSSKKIPARSQIDNARKVLNIVETENLCGRDKELEELTNFLESNVKKATSASMYISGQPGKILYLLNCIMLKLWQLKKNKYIFRNWKNCLLKETFKIITIIE